VELEAEEEEEEGRQAGLGDFGFGGVSFNEEDEVVRCYIVIHAATAPVIPCEPF
jgi:hypothetical protein